MQASVSRQGFAAICASLIGLISIFQLNGAPHEGESFDLRQPDGTRVPVLVWGDEFYQDVESPDGFTLVRDPATGWICFATVGADGQELVSSGIVYRGSHGGSGSVAPPPPAIKQHLRKPISAIRREQEENRLLLGYDELVTTHFADDILLPGVVPPPAAPRTVVGLTLLIDFPDLKSAVTRTEINNFCNQVGYTGNGNNGSIRDYFHDVSGGLLTYTNVVSEFVTVTNNKSYYERTDGYAPMSELITDALNRLRARGFDFTRLTTENGVVVAFNIMYAGAPESGWAKGLWPHASSYSGGFSANGISFRRYQLTAIRTSLTMGTFVHENGHMLMKWPDLYSYDGHSNGVGRFCVMNSNTSKNPQQPNAYFRSLAGWIDLIDITTAPLGKQYFHAANSHSAFAYYGTNTGSTRELFLIEARRKKGRSTDLPGEGLAIWHVNKDGNNTTSSKPPLVRLVQADGRDDLENKRNSGDANDLYRAGLNARFNDATVPNSIWKNKVPSRIDIANISAVRDTMSFSIGPNLKNTCRLTVQNGSGSGEYEQGARVTVTATQAPTGSAFLRWSSATLAITNTYATQASVLMGSADAAVAAHFCKPAVLPGLFRAESFGYQQGVETALTTDSGGGNYAGWMDPGDCMEYVVDVKAQGEYRISYRVASTNDAGTFRIRDVTNNRVLDTIVVSSTGDWQSWATVSGALRQLPAGKAVWRFEAIVGSFNINWIVVQRNWNLQVVSGSGSGGYTAGSTVTIEADQPPAHKLFAGWQGEPDVLAALADPHSATTTLTMPDCAVVLTAAYVDSPTVGILMPSDSGTVVSVSDTFFYDNAGAYSGYSHDFTGEITFVPATAGCAVVLNFEMIDIADSIVDGSSDSLLVFSGSGEVLEPLGWFYGTEVPGPMTSMAVDGSITVRFVSNTAAAGAGWKIHVTQALQSTSTRQNSQEMFTCFDMRNIDANLVYQIPGSGHVVSIIAYDLQGKVAAVLVQGHTQPGIHTISLAAGRKAPLCSGVYIVRMTAGRFSKALRVVTGPR